MDILVCVKHVVDTTEVRIDKNSKELVLRGIPTKINDYDKNAIEEAVKIKKATGGDVTLLTIGPKEAQKTLKEGLAMGADQAYLIDDASLPLYDSIQIAKTLGIAINHLGKFDIIFCGSVSEDIGNNITGSSLAEWLDLEQLSYVQKLEINNDAIVAEQKTGQVIETIEAQLPTVVIVERSINTPRLPTAIQVMKVKSNRIKKLTLDEIGMTDTPEGKVELDGYKVISTDRKRIVFEGDVNSSVYNLYEQLTKEGVL